MTMTELSNYSKKNRFDQSYREEFLTNKVQTYPKTYSAKSCVVYPTSKIHTGLIIDPKITKPTSKRPELSYLTMTTGIS